MDAEHENAAARQITALLHDYARFIDTGSFTEFAGLFRHGDWSGRGGYEGSLAYLQDTMILYDGTPRTHHVITNVTVDVHSEDEASATSYGTVLQQLPEEAIQVMCTLTYADTFWRPEGAWAFRTRKLRMTQVGDLSRHLRVLPKYLTDAR